MYRPSHSPIPRIVQSKTRSTPTARIPHIANTTIDLPASVGTLKVLSSETGCLLSGGFGTLGKLGVEVDDGLSSGRGTAGRLEAAMKGELTRFPAYFGRARDTYDSRGGSDFGGDQGSESPSGSSGVHVVRECAGYERWRASRESGMERYSPVHTVLFSRRG